MIPLHSALAATDLSSGGRHAAERVAQLCSSGCLKRGTLLHVVELSLLQQLRRLAGDSAPDEAAAAAAALPAVRHEAQEVLRHAGFSLDPAVCVGAVADTVLEQLREHDLLVVGAHGEHPVRDFTVGTTAQRLVRKTHKPVLVVRGKPTKPYRTVLVSVDFSRFSLPAIAYARAIAPTAGICLGHIYEVPFEGNMLYAGVSEEVVAEYRARTRAEAQASMQALVAAASADGGPPPHVVLTHGSPASTRLLDQVKALGADLVVVGKHGHSLTEDLLLGSVTQHLLASAHCDVLVIQ